MTLLTRFPIPPACNSIIRSILTDEKWNRENHGNPDTCIKLFPSINRNEPTSNQSLDRPKPAPRKLIKINQHAQFPPTWKENCEYEPTQKRITRNWIVRFWKDRGIWKQWSKDLSRFEQRFEPRISPRFWIAKRAPIVSQANWVPATREPRATYDTRNVLPRSPTIPPTRVYREQHRSRYVHLFRSRA